MLLRGLFVMFFVGLLALAAYALVLREGRM